MMLFHLSAGEGGHAMIHELGSTLLIVLLDMQHFQF